MLVPWSSWHGVPHPWDGTLAFFVEVIEPVISKKTFVMVLTPVETVDNFVDRCPEAETTSV